MTSMINNYSSPTSGTITYPGIQAADPGSTLSGFTYRLLLSDDPEDKVTSSYSTFMLDDLVKYCNNTPLRKTILKRIRDDVLRRSLDLGQRSLIVGEIRGLINLISSAKSYIEDTISIYYDKDSKFHKIVEKIKI